MFLPLVKSVLWKQQLLYLWKKIISFFRPLFLSLGIQWPFVGSNAGIKCDIWLKKRKKNSRLYKVKVQILQSGFSLVAQRNKWKNRGGNLLMTNNYLCCFTTMATLVPLVLRFVLFHTHLYIQATLVPVLKCPTWHGVSQSSHSYYRAWELGHSSLIIIPWGFFYMPGFMSVPLLCLWLYSTPLFFSLESKFTLNM